MNDLDEERAKLLGSFILFTKVFYKIRTGREFNLSNPISRESHFITIAKALTKVLRGEILSLLINIEPGSGKSELCRHFVAWALAHHPDSNFIYVSYSLELAAKNTGIIRDIVSLPHYRKVFGIEIDQTSRAKDNFRTLYGGVIYAAGSNGTITGQDAGLPITDRFSGALIIDDIHKPEEVHSDTVRERVKSNYHETILPRLRSPRVPIINIGQRLREDDLSENIKTGTDGRKWDTVILESLDELDNALYPEVHSKEFLINLRNVSPYVFASQYQQDPLPSGGGIFKKEWFVLLDEEPEFLETFITVDTAETDKNYNDPTVFSFWGLYKIVIRDTDTGAFGLHWIDCVEGWYLPKDLQSEFTDFWIKCRRHKKPPLMAAIEKKSTGVTLLSVLGSMQGLNVVDIERTKASGNKTARFLEMQPYIAAKEMTLPAYGKHSQDCIEHMRKITANDTHKHDDRCDTAYDAVKIALIDKSIYVAPMAQKADEIVASIAAKHAHLKKLKDKAYGQNSR